MGVYGRIFKENVVKKRIHVWNECWVMKCMILGRETKWWWNLVFFSDFWLFH